jgi:hypothetical protein
MYETLTIYSYSSSILVFKIENVALFGLEKENKD